MDSRYTHGQSGGGDNDRRSGAYKSWIAMKSRCYNKNSNWYHRYGGRGIEVCAKWKDNFSAFYEDMGDRPDGLTLDRIDNNGNYSPENCRWATYARQMYNRSGKRGVTKNNTSKNPYVARITVNHNTFHIGCFSTEDQAIEAYNRIAMEWYGEMPNKEVNGQERTQI